MKDSPKALSREKDVPLISGRIIAIKGVLPELVHGYNAEIEQKLLDMEVASLYVPADKNIKAIIKVRRSANPEIPINQMEAPREFVIRVVEAVCGGGNTYKEGSSITLSI